MNIDRRTVLKGVALAPALSVFNSPLVHAVKSLGSSEVNDVCYVNILVHGLCFMEFQDHKDPTRLVITAPDIDMHKYGLVSGGFFYEFPSNHHDNKDLPCNQQINMDWTDNSLSGLQQGTITSFGHYPAIPQFSLSETGVGRLSDQYRLRIILPLPEQIIPLRNGRLSDFKGVTYQGGVRDNIVKYMGNNDNFALATCFRYKKKNDYRDGSPPVATYSLHAEHQDVPEVWRINEAYHEASKAFVNPDKFDLKLKPTDSAPFVPLDPHAGYGIGPDDERSLPELLPPTQLRRRVVSVGGCILFGINT